MQATRIVAGRWTEDNDLAGLQEADGGFGAPKEGVDPERDGDSTDGWSIDSASRRPIRPSSCLTTIFGNLAGKLEDQQHA